MERVQPHEAGQKTSQDGLDMARLALRNKRERDSKSPDRASKRERLGSTPSADPRETSPQNITAADDLHSLLPPDLQPDFGLVGGEGLDLLRSPSGTPRMNTDSSPQQGHQQQPESSSSSPQNITAADDPHSLLPPDLQPDFGLVGGEGLDLLRSPSRTPRMDTDSSSQQPESSSSERKSYETARRELNALHNEEMDILEQMGEAGMDVTEKRAKMRERHQAQRKLVYDTYRLPELKPYETAKKELKIPHEQEADALEQMGKAGIDVTEKQAEMRERHRQERERLAVKYGGRPYETAKREIEAPYQQEVGDLEEIGNAGDTILKRQMQRRKQLFVDYGLSEHESYQSAKEDLEALHNKEVDILEQMNNAGMDVTEKRAEMLERQTQRRKRHSVEYELSERKSYETARREIEALHNKEANVLEQMGKVGMDVTEKQAEMRERHQEQLRLLYADYGTPVDYSVHRYIDKILTSRGHKTRALMTKEAKDNGIKDIHRIIDDILINETGRTSFSLLDEGCIQDTGENIAALRLIVRHSDKSYKEIYKQKMENKSKQELQAHQEHSSPLADASQAEAKQATHAGKASDREPLSEGEDWVDMFTTMPGGEDVMEEG